MLSIDAFKNLVILMQHKWPRFKVMTLISQGSYYSMEFFIIGAVIAFIAIKPLIEMCKRSLGLH